MRLSKSFSFLIPKENSAPSLVIPTVMTTSVLAADGHTLATVLSESHAALDVAAGDGASPRQLLSSPGGMVVNWTPSGRLLIDQDVRISLVNPDSGARTALTPDGQLGI